MKKFSIKFIRLVQQEYTAFVEAESEDKARGLFDESPFDYVENEFCDSEQGLNIDIISVDEEDS